MTEQERFEREANRDLLNIGQRDDTNVVKVYETPQLLVDYMEGIILIDILKK